MPGRPPGISVKSAQPLGAVADPGAPVGDGERAVVGRDRLHRAGRDPVPQLLDVPRIAQRRRAHERLAVGIGEPGGVEVEVLRARLRDHVDAALARRAHLGQRGRRREVHHVHARLRALGQRGRARDGFGFELRGPRQRVLQHAGAALGERLAAQRLDRAAVLAVQRDERAVLARRCA